VGWRDFFKRPARESEDDAPSSAPSNADRRVLRELRRARADLSRPREVVHFLYFPTQVAAEKAATQLRGEGFAIDVRPSAKAGETPNPWVMEARIHTVIDESTVGPMRERFEALAADGGGEYDGWEAAVR
jgi:hypothetical protein